MSSKSNTLIAKNAYIIFGRISVIASYIALLALFISQTSTETPSIGSQFTPVFLAAFSFGWNLALDNKYMAKFGQERPKMNKQIVYLSLACVAIGLIIADSTLVELLIAFTVAAVIQFATIKYVMFFVNKNFKPFYQEERRKRARSCQCDSCKKT